MDPPGILQGMRFAFCVLMMISGPLLASPMEKCQEMDKVLDETGQEATVRGAVQSQGIRCQVDWYFEAGESAGYSVKVRQTSDPESAQALLSGLNTGQAEYVYDSDPPYYMVSQSRRGNWSCAVVFAKKSSVFFVVWLAPLETVQKKDCHWRSMPSGLSKPLTRLIDLAD